jgi:hypothetical protein
VRLPEAKHIIAEARLPSPNAITTRDRTSLPSTQYLLDLSEQLGGLQIVPSSTSDPIARTPAKEKRHYKPPATAIMALDTFFNNKIESMKLEIIQGQAVLRRLEAQRNEYNSRVRLLREELGLLQQPGSYVGEVVKVMGTKKVLVKVHPEGKYGMKVHRALITN